MLQEVRQTQQVAEEPFRRWYSDDVFDLIVWHAKDNRIVGFQLCYRIGTDEHALTWTEKKGVSHRRIDDGEGRPARHKMTPIFVFDGTFNKDRVLSLFEEHSRTLDQELVRIVKEKISNYPAKDRKG